MTDDDDGPSRRQVARRARKDDGDRSSRLAHELLALSAAALGRLGLDAALRAEVDASRRITAMAARRREERRLAGVIRRVDADDLEARLTKVRAGRDHDDRPFHQAEAWRTRLLDGGQADHDAFVATFPDVLANRLDKLVVDARRERELGTPRGAGRALFRVILAALTGPAPEPTDDD